MTGGLMALLAVGPQNQYTSQSPEMSYWRQVYKRHTNFSMESIQATFQTAPILNASMNQFTCRIGRHGDLLGNVYMSIELPDIYSDGNLRFRWVKNLGCVLLNHYYVNVDTQRIDERWGQFMDIWSELSHTHDKRRAFDKMTGNTADVVDPKSLQRKVTIDNNNLSYTFYPAALNANSPSIAKRRIYIPLDFWFTKSNVLALPLVGLQYQNIDITVELPPITSLYQVWDPREGINGGYISPLEYMSRYPGVDASISAFTQYGGGGPSTLFLNAYMECNYIFLDTIERNHVAISNTDYLVERVYQNTPGSVKGIGVLDMTVSNPIKEIVFVFRRSDANIYNDWTNYTKTHPSSAAGGILSTAKVLFNGMDLFKDKDAAFFNQLQPYTYHSNSPRQGVYCYSFALYPEKVQPSGSFNATMINKTQLYVTLTDSDKYYDAFVYSIYYNIFRVMSGSGAMVFTS
jgi:Major capsid protein N-terminus/Large eukaryotic DNA virus major capsid protein